MREESTYQALLDAYTQRGHEVLALEREIAHLRRGIKAYRTICVCPKEVAAGKQHVWLRDGFGKDVPCESCAWEREDAKRQEERVDER